MKYLNNAGKRKLKILSFPISNEGMVSVLTCKAANASTNETVGTVPKTRGIF